MSTTASARNPSPDDAHREAYRECERLARRHYENFPVASFILPRRLRKHVTAIYAFARTADDFADEAGIEDRLERLDEWEARLRRCADGEASMPLFQALGRTIRTFDLPVQLFVDLLNAFRQDVTTHRHERFEDLLAYSRLSANPVGRLMLLLFGYHNEPLALESDSICTALQLTNFWQDVESDWGRGRVYIPLEDMRAFGYTEADLEDRLVNDAFRKMMSGLIEKTRDLFEQGRPLGHRIGGRLGLEIRMIWLGGTRILRSIEEVDYDVFRRRPRLHLGEKTSILLRALFGDPSAG